MSEPERSLDSDGEIIASGAKSVAFLRFQLVLWTLLFLLWGWQAVAEGEGLQIVMAVLAGIALAVQVFTALSSPRLALVLYKDHLELLRRFRPLLIARSEVVAVRGDVPGRPTWSERVVVQTRSGEVSLPAFDRNASEIITRVQEWADVREHPSD